MKQILISLLALFTLCACNKVDNNTQEESPKPTSGTVETINQDEFMVKIADYTAEKWLYLGDMPAIVDFYATWCGPCKMIEPSLYDLAAKYDGKIRIYRIDIDDEPDPARALGVSSIPALLFIPMKGDPSFTVGARSFQYYDELVQTKLLNNIE